MIDYEAFSKIDIRAGEIIKAASFPGAKKPAYQLWIDLGPIGVKKSSAQITGLYTPQELVGKHVLTVVNLPPRQIANFISEVLVLGVVLDEGNVALVQPDRDVPPGKRVL